VVERVASTPTLDSLLATKKRVKEVGDVNVR
jgi:hypothetical protein